MMLLAVGMFLAAIGAFWLASIRRQIL